MIVLLDCCSYTFYRVTASAAWYRRYAPGEPISVENETFMSSLEKQYWSHLEKFCKKRKIELENIYLIRDSPIESLWRRKVYSGYKKKREAKDHSIYGPMIKYMNDRLESRFKN